MSDSPERHEHPDSGPAVEPFRIALVVEYDGTGFSGWQRQSSPPLPTVQASLELALTQIADHPVRVLCAGRTDAGVHATGQVVHFDAQKDRGAKAWRRGGNSLLPDGVCIRWAGRVDGHFHARFSAQSRRYRYVILESDVPPALLAHNVTHVRGRLDEEAMQQAAEALPGEHDFSAFRAAGCQSESPFRNVHHVRVSRRGPLLVIDIQANAFLQHMVRNIAGALIAVGRHERPPSWLGELLRSGDRRVGAATASPSGLYLVSVGYPPEVAIPVLPPGPFFLGPDGE